MKNKLVFGILIFLLGCCKQQQKDVPIATMALEPELIGVQKWFDAWELVTSDVLKIQPHKPPLMLFFDDEFLYTNAPDSVKSGLKINGPTFFGKELSWSKKAHNDSIMLPLGQKVPVGLMSFAAPIETGSEDAFFIMGVPSFWKEAKVKSKELGDENLYTSVFLHEFSHTQQSKNFGMKLDEFDQKYSFKLELSDDMIQEDFGQDSLYTKKIRKEIKTFYDAFSTENLVETKSLAGKGLAMYDKRQKEHFVDNREMYAILDDFFLTMEGMGQYIAVAWLTHPQGGDLTIKLAVDGMRRGGKWWSQDESLALFLIYTKICNPELGKEMFGSDVTPIIELLSKQIQRVRTK